MCLGRLGLGLSGILRISTCRANVCVCVCVCATLVPKDVGYARGPRAHHTARANEALNNAARKTYLHVQWWHADVTS